MEEPIITLNIDDIKDINAESIKQMIAESAAEILVINPKSNQDRAIILDNTKKETPKKPNLGNLMKFYLASCAIAQALAPTPNEKELETFRKEAEEFSKALEQRIQRLDTKPVIDETPWYYRFLKK
jgi:hypothetical protein